MDIRELAYLMTTLYAVFDMVISEPFNGRRVKIDPKFLATQTTITVHRGETAVLQCHILHVGTKTVVWRRKISDVPLTIGEDTFTQDEPNISIKVFKSSEETSQWDLIIKNVQPRHSGMYLCQVTASKLYTHYVTLKVLNESVTVEPDIEITGNKYVDQGTEIRLTCNATGVIKPPLDVEWYFSGEPVVMSKPEWRERTQILRRKAGRSFISTLIVEASTIDYSGNYVCRSSDLKMDSIYVNVLSVEKPKVIKREPDHGNLSQLGDPSGATSGAPCSVLQRVILTRFLAACALLHVLLNITSNLTFNGHLGRLDLIGFFYTFLKCRN